MPQNIIKANERKRIKSIPVERWLLEDSRLSSTLIKLADKGAALKDRRYVPYWA